MIEEAKEALSDFCLWNTKETMHHQYGGKNSNLLERLFFVLFTDDFDYVGLSAGSCVWGWRGEADAWDMKSFEGNGLLQPR